MFLGGIGTFFFIRQRKKKKALAMSTMVNPMLNNTVTSTNSVNASTSTTKPSNNQVVLEQGSRGENVSKLQQLLNKVGGAKLKVDGIFGSKTKAALQKITGSTVATPNLLMDLAKKAMSSFLNLR